MPAAGASLPAAEQAGAGGAREGGIRRRGLRQLAWWEAFSGAGAEKKTRILNKAETKVVRLKEAEQTHFLLRAGQTQDGYLHSRTGSKPALLG